MIEQLKEIDTQTIDELIQLKQEKDVLTERLERLDEQEGLVSSVVLERVREDYDGQRRRLLDKAQPLKEKARHEFAKLEELVTAAREALKAIDLDREELEVRHQVGEFADEEFTSKRDEISESQSRQESDLAQIEEVRENFLAAFDSEEDLVEAPSEDQPPTPEPEIFETQETAMVDPGETELQADLEHQEGEVEEATEAEGDGEADEGQDALDDVEASEFGETEVSGEVEENGEAVQEGFLFEDDEEDSENRVLPPLPDSQQGLQEDFQDREISPEMQRMPTAVVPRGGSVRPFDPGPPLEDASQGPSTTILQQARLVPVEPIAGGAEFAIEPITTIGRTKENLIRIDEPAVSRNHAQVSLTDEGYLLRDLGSENGTYVNGERTATRILAEGDRVQIGSVRFVYYEAG